MPTKTRGVIEWLTVLTMLARKANAAVAIVVVDTEVTRLTAAVAGTWNGARDGTRPP